MAISGSAIYLSSFLLEKNRWNGKGPSLLVSDWMEEAGEAGYAGLEIWMNHLHFSSREEWELIKERSAESDLPISLISATLPVDSSDKSERYRESVIEACDYFRPDAFKFGFAEANFGKSGGLDSLEFAKEWCRDVPREIGMLFNPGESVDAETLQTARGAWSGDRFKAVLHPFLYLPGALAETLKSAGDFVANLSVQAKREGKWILLEENAEANLKIIAAARENGFKGTWSLELSKGADAPKLDIEGLFDNAEKDLNFLIEAQTRSGKTRPAKSK